MLIVFWSFACLILWHFLGYGLTLLVLSRFKRRASLSSPDSWPEVSIIISAFNEENVIARRIENCLALEYPKNRLEIIIGSDGSTDKTVEIARRFETKNVKVLDFPQNRGRSQVHNDCVEEAKGEIIFFTDADTLYKPDCLKKMVACYSDPAVGAVGGELQSSSFQKSSVGQGQGIYWKWEYTLRQLQSKLGVLTKLSGANMSIKKELYQAVPDNFDIDQAVGPMVRLHNHQLIHEPNAIAYEDFPTSLLTELSTRRRLTIRALTAILHYKELLNPLKHPWLAFHFISYRLLRYVTPFLLLGIFISNGFLLGLNWFYNLTFGLQSLSYLFGFFGFLFELAERKFRPFSWAFAFLWFNVGIFLGDIDFLIGRRIKAYKAVDN